MFLRFCKRASSVYHFFGLEGLVSHKQLFCSTKRVPENRHTHHMPQSTWSCREIFSPGASPTHPTFAQNLMTSHLQRALIGGEVVEGGGSWHVRTVLLCCVDCSSGEVSLVFRMPVSLQRWSETISGPPWQNMFFIYNTLHHCPGRGAPVTTPKTLVSPRQNSVVTPSLAKKLFKPLPLVWFPPHTTTYHHLKLNPN